MPPHAKQRVEADGITYTTCGGSEYKSLAYHRGKSSTKEAKSLWRVPRDYECHTFCLAEADTWTDEEGNFWSIRDDGEKVLGSRDERLAFFWHKDNPTVPWHGFPVGNRSGLPAQRQPPDDLINKWYSDGVITFSTQRRLLGGKI